MHSDNVESRDFLRLLNLLVLFYSDEASPGIDDPLAKFSLYPHRHQPGHHKISFQRLSARECAQLCLQVAGENMFNCSSFEHVTATSDCLLTDFSCEDHELLLDNSKYFYQLNGRFDLF